MHTMVSRCRIIADTDRVHPNLQSISAGSYPQQPWKYPTMQRIRSSLCIRMLADSSSTKLHLFRPKMEHGANACDAEYDTDSFFQVERTDDMSLRYIPRVLRLLYTTSALSRHNRHVDGRCEPRPFGEGPWNCRTLTIEPYTHHAFMTSPTCSHQPRRKGLSGCSWPRHLNIFFREIVHGQDNTKKNECFYVLQRTGTTALGVCFRYTPYCLGRLYHSLGNKSAAMT